MKVQSQFIEMFGNPVTNPKGWKTSKIKDVAPESPSKESVDGRVWLLNLDMIESNTGKVIEKVYEDSENALSVQPFDEGNVLFSKLRPYLNKVVIPDEPGLATTELVPLRPKGDILNKIFFSHLLRGDQFVNFANDIAGGTKMPRMPLSELRKFECILPPMEEQMKFVAIAELADKSKFVGFKSQFIEMFGECQRKEKLSSLCETFIDGDWIESKDQSEDGIRLVQTGNVGYGYFKDKEDKSRYISEETFNRLHCTEIFAGDILVSRLPDPIGRACIIPEGIGRMITAVDCSIIRLKDVILPEYFISYTMTSTYSAQINEVTTGTTRRRVSRANLGNVLVPCPSLEAQRQFVAISQQADKSKYYYQIA
ncbi:MAG: restriction endonuclease subunit S [Alloprevotella sp.]|nr:restriction endonuclease subunit S [Alloprevotella sp.]